MAEFASHSSVNTTTSYTLFKFNYGYIPQLGQHISTDTSFQGVKQSSQQALWNLLDAHDTILEHSKNYSNKHQNPIVQYFYEMYLKSY